jgi:starch synthase
MTGLVPLYIKTAYKKDPVFMNSKVVYTIGENTFKDKFEKDFLKRVQIHENVKDVVSLKDNNNSALFKTGATYADAITFGAEKPEKKLLEEFSKVKGKKVLSFNAGTDLTDYLQLYNDLCK